MVEEGEVEGGAVVMGDGEGLNVHADTCQEESPLLRVSTERSRPLQVRMIMNTNKPVLQCAQMATSIHRKSTAADPNHRVHGGRQHPPSPGAFHQPPFVSPPS